MAWLVVILLIVLVLVFGFTSSMQSYASAQQAQAQIELARATQVNASGNLVALLVLAAIVLVLLLTVVLVGWVWWRRSVPVRTPTRAVSRPRQIASEDQPAVNGDALGMLVQLMILEQLQNRRPQLPAAQDEPADEPFRWMK